MQRNINEIVKQLDTKYGNSYDYITYICEDLKKNSQFEQIITDPHFENFFAVTKQKYQAGAIDIYLRGFHHLVRQLDPILLTRENVLRIMLLLLLTQEANVTHGANILYDFQDEYFNLKPNSSVPKCASQDRLLSVNHDGAFDKQWAKITNTIPGLPRQFPNDQEVAALLAERLTPHVTQAKNVQVNASNRASANSTTTIQRNFQQHVPVSVVQPRPAVDYQQPVIPAKVTPQQAQHPQLLKINIEQIDAEPILHKTTNKPFYSKSSLNITISTADKTVNKTVEFDTAIVTDTLKVNNNTKLVCGGRDGYIYTVDLTKPRPIPERQGEHHTSFLNIGKIKIGNIETYFSRSAEDVFIYNQSTDTLEKFSIPGSKMIMSVVGLENGWVACADRVGRVYLFNPNDPAKKIYDYEDGSSKFEGDERLSKLSLQNGMLIQSDRFGNQAKPLDLPTIMHNMKPHQSQSEVDYRSESNYRAKL